MLTDFIRTGRYDKNRPFYSTSSPSMDILISSNLERLLYHLSDSQTVSHLMEALKLEGIYTLPEEMAKEMQKDFYGGCCNEEETADTIRRTFEKQGYLVDPHTAVAVKVLEDYRKETGDGRMAVLASTASPYKFADSVLPALEKGAKEEGFDAIQRLSAISGVAVPLPIAQLKDKTARHTQVCRKEEMVEAVLKRL